MAYRFLSGGDDEPLHAIVIKADSDYLVKGMTEWVFKWETNGYKTAKRKLVENAKLFQELRALVGRHPNKQY
jgi:ribonuclease HI